MKSESRGIGEHGYPADCLSLQDGPGCDRAGRGRARAQRPAGGCRGRQHDRGRGQRPPASASPHGHPAEHPPSSASPASRSCAAALSPDGCAATWAGSLRSRAGSAARPASSSRHRSHDARCRTSAARSAGVIAPVTYTPSWGGIPAHSPVLPIWPPSLYGTSQPDAASRAVSGRKGASGQPCPVYQIELPYPPGSSRTVALVGCSGRQPRLRRCHRAPVPASAWFPQPAEDRETARLALSSGLLT